MSRFHVNPTNGEVGSCKATKSCPFGGDEVHASTREDAAAAYERYVENNNDPAISMFSPLDKKPRKDLHIATDRINEDGSITMPEGTYELVPGDSLNDDVRKVLYAADIEDLETKPVRLPDGSIMIAMKADTQYSLGYYASVAVLADQVSAVASQDQTPGAQFYLDNSDTFNTYENDGDFGLVINGKNYSISEGDEMPTEKKMTAQEIRLEIAKAVRSKQVWQGGDSELAAARTKANVEEQDAKIARLEKMLPAGAPKNGLEVLRKVLYNEGGEASVEEMKEYLDSYEGGYASDREFEQRRKVLARIAKAEGFAVGEVKDDGYYKTTQLGNGYVMEETDPSRVWGGSMTIRDNEGKTISQSDRTSSYVDPEKALQAIGQSLRNPNK